MTNCQSSLCRLIHNKLLTQKLGKKEKMFTIISEKDKRYKCDACGSVSPSLKEYINHVSVNPECNFFTIWVSILHIHWMCTIQVYYTPSNSSPVYKQCHKKKEVTIGQILELSWGKLPYIIQHLQTKHLLSSRVLHF